MFPVANHERCMQGDYVLAAAGGVCLELLCESEAFSLSERIHPRKQPAQCRNMAGSAASLRHTASVPGVADNCGPLHFSCGRDVSGPLRGPGYSRRSSSSFRYVLSAACPDSYTLTYSLPE